MGVATDGVASNNNFDMFEEMRTAALLQKGIYKDATKFPAQTALAMATRMGAEAIGMGHTGSLWKQVKKQISLLFILIIKSIYNRLVKHIRICFMQHAEMMYVMYTLMVRWL